VFVLVGVYVWVPLWYKIDGTGKSRNDFGHFGGGGKTTSYAVMLVLTGKNPFPVAERRKP
jgi:hypothetical protein